MDIEISIFTIAKVALAVLGSYFLLPLVLVLRDMILWKFIDKYILTDDLYKTVKRHCDDVEQWNQKVARKTNMSFKEETGVIFTLDGEEVSQEKWDQNNKLQDHLSQKIEKDRWLLQKRSNLINWLLKHYKQDKENPIDRWVKIEAKRAARKYQEKQLTSQASGTPKSGAPS